MPSGFAPPGEAHPAGFAAGFPPAPGGVASAQPAASAQDRWAPFVGRWVDADRQIESAVLLAPLPGLSVADDAAVAPDGSSLQFTVCFPPDATNPDGRARWTLRPDGAAAFRAGGADGRD
eukprot:gene6847-36311_t